MLTGSSEFTGPRTREEVLVALELWRAQGPGKCCVFFLDEIPALWSEDRENRVLKYRMMTNVFRSLGIVAILSATHAPPATCSRLREV